MPSLGVVFGFGMGEAMKQDLDAACENGDLTRAGVRAAFDELEEVDTGGLIVPIRGFELEKSPSLSSFILRPADVPGGAEIAAAPLLGAGGGLCLAAGLTLTARLAAPTRLGALTSLFLACAYIGFAAPFATAVAARATSASLPLAVAAGLTAALALRLVPVARAGRL